MTLLNEAPWRSTPEDTDIAIGLAQPGAGSAPFADALDWGNKLSPATPYEVGAPEGIVGDAFTELGRYDDAVGAIQQHGRSATRSDLVARVSRWRAS